MKAITRRNFVLAGALAGAGAFAAIATGCSQAQSQASSASAAVGSVSASAGPAAASASASASANSTQSAGATSSGKTLVAYFSAQGHTKSVAQAIADELGADIFEIVPQNPYTDDDLNWNNGDSRVSLEHDDETKRDVPLAQATPDNFADYDTVFVGYPIWWGGAAWPIEHFVTDNDFGSKRVVPFCTSASSGLGQSASDLAALAGSGNWEGGQRFASSADESEVRAWISSVR